MSQETATLICHPDGKEFFLGDVELSEWSSGGLRDWRVKAVIEHDYEGEMVHEGTIRLSDGREGPVLVGIKWRGPGTLPEVQLKGAGELK